MDQQAIAAESRHTCFAGRWLVISEGGDCLLDYSHNASERLLNMPLAASCSLIAAMTQFVTAVGVGTSCEAGSSSVHAVSLGDVHLCICRGSTFSVAAATQEQGSHVAAIRCKATEMHAALSAAVGEALLELCEVSTRQRQEQMNNYTLSSMLDSGGDDASESMEHLLDPKALLISRSIMTTTLSHRYDALLQDTLNLLADADRKLINSVCIFDDRIEIVVRVAEAVDGSCGFKECFDWRGAELIRAAAADKSSVLSSLSLWSWVRGQSRFTALLGQSLGSVRVGIQLNVQQNLEGLQAEEVEQNEFNYSEVLQVMQLPLQIDSYSGVAWVVAKLTQMLANVLCLTFDWPVGLGLGDQIGWGRKDFFASSDLVSGCTTSPADMGYARHETNRNHS